MSKDMGKGRREAEFDCKAREAELDCKDEMEGGRVSSQLAL